MNDMPILERRRLEATLLRHVYETLRERYGEEEARTALGAAVSRAAIEHGQGFAERLGRTPDLADMLDILPLWTKDGALEIEVHEATPERLDFDVVRCRYAEMYRAMGLGDIGHLLSCNRDGDFCKGFNPEMQLTRTRTIMQGAGSCDFRYRLTKTADP